MEENVDIVETKTEEKPIYSSPPRYRYFISMLEILDKSLSKNTVDTNLKLRQLCTSILTDLGSDRKGGKDAVYLAINLGLIKKVDNRYIVDETLFSLIRNNKEVFKQLKYKEKNERI